MIHNQIFKRLIIGLSVLISVSLAEHAPAELHDETAFNISPQALDSALLAFSEQANIQLVVAATSLEGIESQGIIGRVTAESALSTLLHNTGLQFSIVGETVTVMRAGTGSNSGLGESQPASGAMQLAQIGKTADQAGLQDSGTIERDGAPAQDTQFLIEEVIVTARKREESLQKVPISITAFERRAIERLGASRFRDLEHVIPNLTINGPPSNAAPVISIRGVSSEASNIGFESSLSVYVDGVYQGRPVAFNQDLDNISSLQVLRGPQGTFFGRNATAGAIVITNPTPGENFEMYAGLEYSSFNTIRANGSVSGKLGKTLYGRVAAFGVKSDGYMLNTFNDDKINNEDAFGVNFNLRSTPTDRIELTLRGDVMTEQREFVFAEQTIANVTAPVIPGRFTTSLDGALDEDRDVGGLSLTADIDLKSDYTITSITAWRFADSFNKGDVDGGTVRALNQTFEDNQKQFSQELRIASPSIGAFNFVAGAYYFYESVDSDRVFDVDQNLLDMLGVPPLPFLQIPPPATKVFLQGVGVVDTENFALFAHGNYQFTDRFSVNFGGRMSWEKKQMEFTQVAPLPLPFIFGQINFSDSDELKESDFSPTIGAAFDADENLRFYGQITSGFKGGGWNLGIQTVGNNLGTAESISFKPEKITNYEIGMRSKWLDNRVLFNLTGCYMDYEDLQVSQFDPTAGISRFTNAGLATMKGAELEFVALASSYVTIGGGLGYLDASFDEFKDAAGPGIDFDGNRLANAPRWTGNLSVDFDYPVGNRGTLVVRGVYKYRSKTYFDSRNDVIRSQDAYGLFDARIGFVAPDGAWEIFVFGMNLTDKEYATVNGPAFFGGLLTNFGLPRTYGIQVRIRR